MRINDGSLNLEMLLQRAGVFPSQPELKLFIQRFAFNVRFTMNMLNK